MACLVFLWFVIGLKWRLKAWGCDVPAALSLSTPKNNQTINADIQNNQFSTFRTDRKKKKKNNQNAFFGMSVFFENVRGDGMASSGARPENPLRPL